MESFNNVWINHHRPLGEAAIQYLYSHKQLRDYPRGRLIKLDNEEFPFLCIVMEGLVGGYQKDRRGRRVLRELALPMDFFTGTQHTFSSRQRPMEFAALKATRLMLISVQAARAGQHRFTEISELFHVLKQRKILRLRKLVEIYQETDAYDRYFLFWDLLPEIAGSPMVTNATSAELLRMSLGHQTKIKRKYFGKPGK